MTLTDALLESLDSCLCPVCGGGKEKARALCGACEHSLPDNLRWRLCADIDKYPAAMVEVFASLDIKPRLPSDGAAAAFAADAEKYWDRVKGIGRWKEARAAYELFAGFAGYTSGWSILKPGVHDAWRRTIEAIHAKGNGQKTAEVNQ